MVFFCFVKDIIMELWKNSVRKEKYMKKAGAVHGIMSCDGFWNHKCINKLKMHFRYNWTHNNIILHCINKISSEFFYLDTDMYENL